MHLFFFMATLCIEYFPLLFSFSCPFIFLFFATLSLVFIYFTGMHKALYFIKTESTLYIIIFLPLFVNKTALLLTLFKALYSNLRSRSSILRNVCRVEIVPRRYEIESDCSFQKTSIQIRLFDCYMLTQSSEKPQALKEGHRSSVSWCRSREFTRDEAGRSRRQRRMRSRVARRSSTLGSALLPLLQASHSAALTHHLRPVH